MENMNSSAASFSAMLRCSHCGQGGLNGSDPRQVACNRCGATFPIEGTTVRMSSTGAATPQWQRKQRESISRYSEPSYNSDTTLPDLFGAFIAATLPAAAVVIDIGCGIAAELPVYARGLRARYIGLEPLDLSVDRTYSCISGAVAEAIPVADNAVDAALFATSLDHIQDVPKALAEIQRILRDEGRMYLWVGLHDPELELGAHTLQKVFFSGSFLVRTVKLLTAQVVLAKFAVAVALRQSRIRRGIPLDAWHFHYYSRGSLRQTLTDAGFSIVRDIVVPGTTSTFLECRHATIKASQAVAS
jgi:SAM-dependent methyltransferase